MSIQFATGVRTSKYEQFAQGVCTKIQEFTLTYGIDNVIVTIDKELYTYYLPNQLFRISLNPSPPELEELAINDGFKDFNGFLKYFDKSFLW